MGSLITLRTGIILGRLINGSAVIKYEIPTGGEKKVTIPVIFRNEGGQFIFFNGSVNEKDMITLVTPRFERQEPYEVSALGRRGVDITDIIAELAKGDISRVHVTANAAEASEVFVCAEAFKLTVDYEKAMPLGVDITAEWRKNNKGRVSHLLLKANHKSFSSVPVIKIGHVGDSQFSVYNIPAERDGTVLIALPVNIAEGQCLNVWLTAYLNKNN